MKRDKILVFIPMYNCEKQIIRVIDNFPSDIAEYIHKVLIIDNGSKDNGIQVVTKKLSTIKNNIFELVQNVDNYNLGGSHKVAFNYCLDNHYDYCIVLHGDDQADFKDIIPYLKSGEYKKYDCFLGARFHKKSKLIGYSKFKTFGNHGLNLLLSIGTLFRIQDMGSGINMYNCNFLSSKFYLYYPNNLTFNVFLLLASIYKKSKIYFFPITWKEFDQVSNAKVFKQAFIILKLLFFYILNRKATIYPKQNEYSKIDYKSKSLISSKNS